MRATPEQLEAFSRLRNSEVLKYFQQALAECHEQLVTQSDIELIRRVQGQAQMLRQLIHLVGQQGQ